MLVASPVHQILDLARWAPSGDNTQPWRFEILDDSRFVIHGFDTRDHCVYDLDGRPSQLSLGALIETIDIAASAFRLRADITRRTDLPDMHPTFDVVLVDESDRTLSKLVSAIPERTVCRRPMRLLAISEADRLALAAAVGPDHDLMWYPAFAQRLRWASLLWLNAGLRLRLPEAFEVHRQIIDWDTRFSKDRIPDQALGASRPTLALMRRAMTSWKRVDFLNTWLGGTIAPRLEMDWIPALACSAHIAIVAKHPLLDIDDYVAGGRAVQRFWLTATNLGLQHQPAITPLIFARCVREQRAFTKQRRLADQAAAMSTRLDSMLDDRTRCAVWLGRLGVGTAAPSRSERLPLNDLVASTSESV